MSDIKKEDIKKEEKIRGEEATNFKYKYNFDDLSKLKQAFLEENSQLSEDTKIGYTNLMFRIHDYEVRFKNGKDLYNFTYDEILDMLGMFGSSSVNTLNVYLSIIRKYIDFAIENKYLGTGINLANNIQFEDLEELVNKTAIRNRFITREELYNLVLQKDNKGEYNLKNPQDQAVILLIFEGIRGINNSELVNLKREDIDLEKLTINVNREVKVKDEKGNTSIQTVKITIKIPESLAEVIKRTNEQTHYLLNNGKYTGKKSGEEELLTLEETSYLLRPMRTKDDNLGRLTGQVIQRRVLTTCQNELGLKFATVNSIYMSGIFDRLHRYSQELGRPLKYIDADKYLKEHYESVNTYQVFAQYKDFYGLKDDETKE